MKGFKKDGKFRPTGNKQKSALTKEKLKHKTNNPIHEMKIAYKKHVDNKKKEKVQKLSDEKLIEEGGSEDSLEDALEALLDELGYNPLAPDQEVVTEPDDVEAPDPRQEDTDEDGYADAFDAFPEDPEEWFDTDGDGIGNNADTDDDNDGVLDDDDAFPLDDTEWLDTDADVDS